MLACPPGAVQLSVNQRSSPALAVQREITTPVSEVVAV